VRYCTQAHPRYAMAQDRLIIPVIMNGVEVGWQARYAGEIAWKAERIPKYFTQPGMQKSRVLYNHDLAVKQPIIVVCEGPSDVWRVGPSGVGLLGKQATIQQRALLAKQARDKPVIVLLDGDAVADSNRLREQLKPLAHRGLAQVRLSYGRDPGSYPREELWSIIHQQAASQDVAVPADSIAQSVNEVSI
jgi:hypothetical protein